MELKAVVAQLVDHLDALDDAQTSLETLTADELALVAEGLKRQTLFYVRRDAPKALAIAELMLHIADWHTHASVRALGLQTKAIVLVLLEREYEKALELFAASEALYADQGDELAIAIGQVTRVWALACLQCFEQAYAAGDWAERVLTAHQRHRTLAALNNNLAAIYGRRGQDTEALERVLKVEAAYRQLGEEGERRLPLAHMNRAIVLRNLGRFQESILANQQALHTAETYDQTANIARARQNLGVTYFILGRFNEAHSLLQQARDTFLADQRYRDAILVELFISDGLLHLRRFEAVLEKCQQVRQTFQAVGTQFEVAQALLNEATALIGLRAYARAHSALDQAQQIFVEEQNSAWCAYTDLEEALLLYWQGDYATSARLAQQCAAQLAALGLPVKQAQAQLVAARATLALGKTEQAEALITQALGVGQEKAVPALIYQGHDIRGQLALKKGDLDAALLAYETAIDELERMQRHIMIEFRSDFLIDKQAIYARAVSLSLQKGIPRDALNYAERAKSRALLSLLSHHVDVHMTARSPQDQALVTQLTALREKRDRLYRRWETGETPGSDISQPSDPTTEQTARQAAREQILTTEDEIRKQWHRLLVRNAAYTQDAALWQVYTQLDQTSLGADTVLLEYFTLEDGIAAFLVSAETIKAYHLQVNSEAIMVYQQRLQHNFNTLRRVPQLQQHLERKVQHILHDLYNRLLAPISEDLDPYRQLIIVPHGPLHYVPFQALYDGHNYVLQRYAISYLPGSSFLGLTSPKSHTTTTTLVMGHSRQGQLTHVAEEVNAVAEHLHAAVYLDQAATRARFQEFAPKSHIVHMAAHGDFRADNPLFSGLHLHDGLLTTLDIFNLHLSASLVTLSACQTGRSAIGGGDELFGLMRAFLAAGTASLVLTLWPVDDVCTTTLMTTFYELLAHGENKVTALRKAQLALITDTYDQQSTHPYYWGPFFLVGDTGQI